jgi:hypothetical protein
MIFKFGGCCQHSVTDEYWSLALAECIHMFLYSTGSPYLLARQLSCLLLACVPVHVLLLILLSRAEYSTLSNAHTGPDMHMMLPMSVLAAVSQQFGLPQAGL